MIVGTKVQKLQLLCGRSSICTLPYEPHFIAYEKPINSWRYYQTVVLNAYREYSIV